jgi:hypothetical protein
LSQKKLEQKQTTAQRGLKIQTKKFLKTPVAKSTLQVQQPKISIFYFPQKHFTLTEKSLAMINLLLNA